jgi:transposase
VAEGTVHGQCFPKHRNTEFLRFLRLLDKAYPGQIELHLILDNYGTHGHANARRWLAKHPRFILHFIPTSSSWLNLVERWFAELTNKAVRRGSFTSVPDLITAIENFITHYNRDPKPFVWTAKAETILAKLERCRERLEQIQPGCTTRKSRKKSAQKSV